MTESSPPPPEKAVPFAVKCLATGFYTGYSPFASGTAGSLLALAAFALPFMHGAGPLIIASVAAFVTGVYVSGVMERSYGVDPSIVVIDEIAGMWISLIALPPTFAVAAIAFFLFRGFDILKPPPARQLERVKGGWGIMLDDVAAAVYANVSVRVILILFPALGGS